MAKTIMIANALYDRLKERKINEDKSFTQVIAESLDREKLKTGAGLRKHIGVLAGDTEFKEIMKEANKQWKKWSEKYA